MSRCRLWLTSAGMLLALTLGVPVLTLVARSEDEAQLFLESFDNCADLHERYVDLALESRTQPRADRYWDFEFEIEEDAPFDESFISSEGAVVDSSELDVGRSEIEQESTDASNAMSTGRVPSYRSDTIQTDGSYLYMLSPRSLLIAAIETDGTATPVSRLDLGSLVHRQELLINGNRLIVLRDLPSMDVQLWPQDNAEIGDSQDIVFPRWGNEHRRRQSLVLEIDVENRSQPRVLRELTIDGSFVTAGRYDDSIRLIMQHHSPVPHVRDNWFDEPNQAENARRFNEALADRFTIDQWYPQFALRNYTSGSERDGFVLPCSQMYVPDQPLPIQNFRPVSTTYLLEFDSSQNLGDWRAAAVMGMGEAHTTYAPYESLYFVLPFNGMQDTAIHHFLLGRDGSPTYTGSRVLQGRMVSQWSLSEHGGYLRVATFDEYRDPVETRVSVLKPASGDPNTERSNSRGPMEIELVGQLGGLGADQTASVIRFAGDLAYLGVERWGLQFHALDLSDVRHPRRAGQFHVPGDAVHLHPLPGDRLIVVALSRDPEFPLFRRGLQAALFDLSDPDKPSAPEVVPLGSRTGTLAEEDSRSVLYHAGIVWLAARPYSRQYEFNYVPHDGAFYGLMEESDTFRHRHTIRVHGYAQRVVPVGDQVYLLTDEELRMYSVANRTLLGAFSLWGEWDERWAPVFPP